MAKDVIVIGAGGHAKVITDIVLENGDNVLGYLDDDTRKHNQIVYKNLKVIDRISNAEKYDGCYFIIAIGNNRTRAKIEEEHRNLRWHTAVHPKAIISDTVEIDVGTVVMAGAVINADSKIGRHCIINTSCSIDHDNIIEDFVHISPGAHLAGKVFVGTYTWICTGATVINNINIRNNVIVGAGATVVKNINRPGIYVGTPARAK